MSALRVLSPIAQVASDVATRPEERRRQVENAILNDFDTALRALRKTWAAAVRLDGPRPPIERETARHLVRVVARLHGAGIR